MAWDWLEAEWQKPAKERVATDPDAKEYQGGDVDSVQGFRVYNETWGHVAGYFTAICAIQPAYIWAGK